MDELTDCALGDAEHRGELGPAQALEGAADQGLALAGGQLVERREHQPRVGARVEQRVRLHTGLHGELERRLHRTPRAGGGVAQDRVQPAAGVADLGAAVQRRERAEQRLLK